MALFKLPGRVKVAGSVLALVCALSVAGLLQSKSMPLNTLAQIAVSFNPAQSLLDLIRARGPADRAQTRQLKLKLAKTPVKSAHGRDHHANRLIPRGGEHHASRLIPGRGRPLEQIPFAIGPLTRPVDFAALLPPILGIDATQPGTLFAAAAPPARNPGAGPGIVGLLPIATPVGSGPPSTAVPPKIQDVPSTPPAVPEPETWVLLIAGFGFIGSAMRRRRLGVGQCFHGLT